MTDSLRHVWLNAKIRSICAFTLLLAVSILMLLTLAVPPRHQGKIDVTSINSEIGHAFIFNLNKANYLLFRFDAGDRKGPTSSLVIYENQQPLGPPHASHQHIRSVGLGAYSHWGENIYFSTSDNSNPLHNGNNYQFSIKLVPNNLLIVIFLLLFLFSFWHSRGVLSYFLAPFIRLAWICCIGASLIYLAMVLLGLAAGDEFAAAAPMRWAGDPTGYIRFENLIARAVIAVGILGSIAVFMSMFGFIDKDRLRAVEQDLLYGRLRFGSPVIAALLLASLGTAWLSVDNVSQYGYVSLFGQIPHADAAGYIASSFGRIAGWEMSQFAARRPVAQSFRDLTVWVAGGSYTVTLMVQAVALALALAFAARRLMLWRGLWAGIAFTGLILLQSRFFLTTTMTEPLGMICALVCVGFLVDAVRCGSARHALLALIWLSLALSIRMGALFVIPALAIWAVLFLEKSWRTRSLAAGLAFGIIVVIITLGKLLKNLYAERGAEIGGNFAMTLCGLSLGGDWTTCLFGVYANEVSMLTDESAVAGFFMKKAIENIIDNPSILIGSLLGNADRFISGFVSFYSSGYGSLPRLPKIVEAVLIGVVLIGFAHLAWRHGSRREFALWILVGLGILASAAIIMSDDGWRALHVTHALIACFLAMACISLANPLPSNKAVTISKAFPATVLFLGLLSAGPYLLARLGPLGIDRDQGSSAERVLVGGRHTLGVLVVSDDDTTSSGPRAVRWSEFRRAYARVYSTDADLQSSLALMEARLPFGLVVYWQRVRHTHLVVPSEVVMRTDVAHWKIRIDTEEALSGSSRATAAPILLESVVSAEPLPNPQPAHR